MLNYILYIRLNSLSKFQDIFDSNEFLQKILSPTDSNVYFIETDDIEKLRELERVLNKNRIKYNINIK